MKKSLPIIFLLLLGLASSLHAATPVTVNLSPSQETFCDGANVDDYWYIGQTHYPRDRFSDGNDKDWLFGMSSSYVKIYNPYNFFQVNGGWNWRSNGKPKGVSEVIIMQNDGGSVLTNHTANPNDLVAQLTYRINRKYSKNSLPGTTTISYTDMSYNYLSQSVNRFDSEIVGDNECVNIYARWCGDGIVSHGEQCDGTAGTTPGVNTCNSSCQIVTSPPTCNPAKTGTQTTPVLPTDTLCSVGTVAGFTTNGTNPVNYTWTCNNASQSVNCSANYSSTPVTGNFDLRIKKYVKGEDIFASVENTEDFNYNIVVQNVGPGKVSGTTTVRDNLPSPVVLRGVPSGNGWTCTGAAGSSSFECTTTTETDPNQVFDVITVPVRVTNLTFRNAGYMNYAYVHNPNEIDGKQCNADGSMPNPALAGDNGQNPRAVCNEDTNNLDSAVINPPNPNGFDLRLKKYVNGDDEASNGAGGVTYTFIVQNLGELASVGRTTVTDDNFPAGVTIASIAGTQGEWTCTKDSDTKFTCYTDKVYAKGEFSTPIVVAATSTITVPGRYQNYACLSNPNDPNEGEPLDVPVGKWKVNNCDPAEIFVVPAGTFDLSLKKYVADLTTGTPLRDGDHQTTNDGNDVDRDILTVPQGGKMRYRFVVKNLGPVTTTGTTTVEDTLPNDTTIISVAGTGWTCTISEGRKFKCTRTEDLTVGASFPDIVADVQASNTILAGEYSNIATVKNPGDTNPTNNTDPANIEIIVGAMCGSITPSPTGVVSPNTSMTYTCSALGFTGTISNLEYKIDCGTSTGTWGTGSTRVCSAPASYSTSVDVTCGVRDKTNPSITFTGSFINSCKTTTTTTSGGGGGGASHVGKTCVNGIATCTNYNSLVACTAAGIPAAQCYSADAAGLTLCQNQSLSCSGPGGPSGPGNPSNWNPGTCGDGVLQAGEECDVRGAPWCNACKLDMTNPGENPITNMWIRIPALSQFTVGTSFLDRVVARGGYQDTTTGEYRLPINNHQIVVGQNSNIFTVADKVYFGINTKYTVPLAIPDTYKVCIYKSTNGGESSAVIQKFGAGTNESCRSIADIIPVSHPSRQVLPGYVILGKGDIHKCTLSPSGVCSYTNVPVNFANEIGLYSGNSPIDVATSGLTLRDAFQGGTPGTEGGIHITFARGDLVQGDRPIDMKIPVRVSAALLSSTATPTNRSIEEFVNLSTRNILAGFLRDLAPKTSLSTVTTNPTTPVSPSIPVTPVANVTLPSSTGDRTLGNPSGDFVRLNGNPNILYVKDGKGYINSPLVVSGVKTIIVENGDLIITSDITYANANSSIAFIVKNGNVVVDKEVSSLAGVFVAISGGANGQFVSLGNTPSQKILKIEGSLYGDAKPLFNSRLYARGTNAYEILTTGTVITYSNRALVNPPPLLSNYLGNYNVSRVVQ